MNLERNNPKKKTWRCVCEWHEKQEIRLFYQMGVKRYFVPPQNWGSGIKFNSTPMPSRYTYIKGTFICYYGTLGLVGITTYL